LSGCVIGSGGKYHSIIGGCCNIINGGIQSFIGSGGSNKICNASNDSSIITGGGNVLGSIAAASCSTILGGASNDINRGPYNSIINGCKNCIISPTGNSIIGTGYYNCISNTPTTGSAYSSILNGYRNTISASLSGNTILNGTCNTISGAYSFIAGGSYNSIPSTANNAFILGNQLSATQSNFTYVNNLSSQGAVYAPIIAGGTQLTTTANTTYTFQLSDNGGTIASTNSTGGLTATVVGTNYPIGFQVGVLQLNTARISVSGQNITINQSNGFYKTTKQYSAATLLYTGTTGWVLFGDLAS
jgi:hypothetical protein